MFFFSSLLSFSLKHLFLGVHLINGKKTQVMICLIFYFRPVIAFGKVCFEVMVLSAAVSCTSNRNISFLHFGPVSAGWFVSSVF